MKEYDSNKPGMSTLTVRVTEEFKQRLRLKAVELGYPSASVFVREAIEHYLVLARNEDVGHFVQGD